MFQLLAAKGKRLGKFPTSFLSVTTLPFRQMCITIKTQDYYGIVEMRLSACSDVLIKS
jgi:hypothetical protein